MVGGDTFHLLPPASRSGKMTGEAAAAATAATGERNSAVQRRLYVLSFSLTDVAGEQGAQIDGLTKGVSEVVNIISRRAQTQPEEALQKKGGACSSVETIKEGGYLVRCVKMLRQLRCMSSTCKTANRFPLR